MRVTYSRRLLEPFRRYAREAYPREAWAAVLGQRNGDVLSIQGIYIPDDQPEWTSTAGFAVPQRIWDVAHRMARQGKMVFLGDIHSHPYPASMPHDRSPGEQDWIRAGAAKILHGVCSVRRRTDGRTTTRIKFWPPTVGLIEQVTR